MGERTLLAVPLTLWTCVSKLTAGDSSDSSQCCVGLRGGEGGTETYTHENFAHEGVRRGGGGERSTKRLLATCSNEHRQNKRPVTFPAKQQQKKEHHYATNSGRHFFFLAILMRYSVRVNKTPLFCLLVSQTASLYV